MLFVGHVPQKSDLQVFVCNRTCFTNWAHKVLSEGYEPGRSGERESLAGVVLRPDLAGNVKTMSATQRRRMALVKVARMVEAARYEDAAQIYETLGMYKEAGDTRRLGQRQVVTHVHVDLNDLIEQLGRLGLSASYTCPACRSPLTVTGQTKPDALATCQYCGALIRPTDLIEAITKVLGYR
jgi:hypothetical protein